MVLCLSSIAQHTALHGFCSSQKKTVRAQSLQQCTAVDCCIQFCPVALHGRSKWTVPLRLGCDVGLLDTYQSDRIQNTELNPEPYRRRLERERKRRREQQEEAALQDFLSGCPSTGEAEYPFATAPSQVVDLTVTLALNLTSIA